MIKTLLKTLLLFATLSYLIFAVVKVSHPTQEMVCTGVEFLFTDSGQTNLIDRPMLEMLLTKNKIAPKGHVLAEKAISLGGSVQKAPYLQAEIDLHDIEQRLSANPYIDTVNCYHTASGKLCVRVTPRRPLLHVFAQDGDEFYIDTKGGIMPAGGLPTDLPIVTGHVTRQMSNTRLLMLGNLLQSDQYWKRQAQQVVINEKGWIEIIPRFSGQRILLGEPKDLQEKLNRVRMFYEKAMPRVGWNKYSTINAAFKNQIICTKL